MLDAHFEEKVDGENTYRIRIEMDIFEETNEESIKEIIHDILAFLEFGMDIKMDHDNGIAKLFYINGSFKFYEINFNSLNKTVNLERLVSFSWDGLKYDKFYDDDVYSDLNKFYNNEDNNLSHIKNMFYFNYGFIYSFI
jgi:hypothetical protein